MMLGWCCYPKLEVQVEEKFWNGGFFTFGVWGPCVPAQSLRSCVTLCDPMDCSPPGSSVHGILQARILQWVAMPSSRGSSWPRDWTRVYLHLLHYRWIFYLLSHLRSLSLRCQRENQAEKSTRKLKGEIWTCRVGLNIHLVIGKGVVIEATTLSKEK